MPARGLFPLAWVKGLCAARRPELILGFQYPFN